MPITKSPLRYPGGKTQLAKYIKHLVELNNTTETYIEPFAGGFGVALELLFSHTVEHIVLNDYDPSIFSIWYSIINRHEEFVELLKNTPVTINEWHQQRNMHMLFKNNPTSIENAFSTFFLNRTNMSGIINARPIGGLNQSGKYKLDCRFNKTKLLDKVNKIYEYRDNITLFNLDANDFIQNKLDNYSPKSTFIFYDPPYFKQGKNLYLSFVDKDAHNNLAMNILNNSSQYKWIVTYDLEDEIYQLYSPFVQCYEYSLSYSANQKKKASEFLFANTNTIVDSFEQINLIKHN